MVNSLKDEFKGKIIFRVANLQTAEGQAFAQVNNVGSVTLVFFRGDGTKITTLTGERSAEFLRKAFNRAFRL